MKAVTWTMLLHPPRQQGALLGAVAEDAELAHAKGEDLARRGEERRVQLAARRRLHVRRRRGVPAQRRGECRAGLQRWGAE